MTLTQLFTNIANAIRAKTGSSSTIIASNFPTEITNIELGYEKSEGENLNLKNSANAQLAKLNINGNSVQDGTPTSASPIEIESSGDGINLLPNEATNQTINGLTFVVNENKSITINGTATANTNYTLIGQSGVATEVLKLNANQNYYNTTSIRLVYRLVNGNYGAINSGAFTSSNDLSIRHIYLSIPSGTTYNNEVIYPQIIKGTSPKGYVPYGKGYINITISNSDNTQSQEFTIPCQQPMRSIGSVRDTFVKVNGVWYEKHVIGQVVLNGSESGWAYDSDNFYFRTSKYTFEHVPKANTNDTVQLSNYFKHTPGWGTFRTSHTTNLFYSVQNSGYKICFRNVDITTVSDWTNWLRSHNVEVIYPTEEPYYLECTQEQTEALESIIRAYTYEPITNINSTDEVSPYLDLVYYKKI